MTDQPGYVEPPDEPPTLTEILVALALFIAFVIMLAFAGDPKPQPTQPNIYERSNQN